MKILSPSQIKEVESFTIKNEPVKSIDLMERAALACMDWLVSNYFKDHLFKIFCGTGNNGGDGLAIARLLRERSFNVEVYIVNASGKRSEEFSINRELLKEIQVSEIKENDDLKKIAFEKNAVVLDCIFGTGLNKKVEGLAASTIEFINKSNCEIIAIDIPSGFFAEDNSNNDGAIIMANHTLTFNAPKLSFMFPGSFKYTGNFTILNIGLSDEAIVRTNSSNHFLLRSDIETLLKTRSKFSHKGNFGHALLACGSRGKIGVAILSARACLRTGVGLLSVQLPGCGNDAIQIAVPEAMTIPDSESDFISDSVNLQKYNSIGVGSGIGNEKQTQNVLKVLIQNTRFPLVIDADGLNILSENKTWLSFLPPNCILTPHVKEFERLAGKTSNDYSRYELQKEFSIKYKVYLILKGAHTAISCPDGNVYFNSTGNAGMATGGSGDVLTGILTGLLAQGYDSRSASCLGVFLHGLAGDIAKDKLGEESMLAGDIIENISAAYQHLRN